MRKSRLRTLRAGVALLAAAAAGWTGGSVAAAPNPCPGSCVLAQLGGSAAAGTSQSVGGAASALTFTIDDESSGPFGSALLTPPSGFTISAPTVPNDGDKDNPPGSPPEVQVLSNVLRLTDLDITRGGRFTVSGLTATASCTATASAWSLVAYKGDNWKGKQLSVDPGSALTVAVTGSCSLAFTSAQPTNAVESTDITSSGFDPSGPPVAVEALDANGSPIPGVTIGLAAQLGPGSLSGSGTSAASGGTGVATFAPISIAQTGYYQLGATAPSFTAATSALFQVTGSAAACSAGCSGSVSSTSLSASVDISNAPASDVLSVGLGGFSYSCADPFSPTGVYQTHGSPVSVDLWLANGSSLDPAQQDEVVTITIPNQLPQPGWGWPFPNPFSYQICYASTVAFEGGTLASAADSIPGYSGSTYIGLLPQCPPPFPFWGGDGDGNGAPCVLSRYFTWTGSLVISFLGAPGDFWGSA